MLIAILMTNTDESEFAQRHPKDGDKFETLLRELRPLWQFEVFSVKDGRFPGDTGRFDGVLITGSPASVRDGEPWIAQLEDLIRELHALKVPMFGACFGHQAIATALGGKVDCNPGGWELGTVETEFIDGRQKRPLNLYAAHKEQVILAPTGAAVTATAAGCPIAGFAIGDHIATTQYHPEMTPEFIAALLDELERELDPKVIAAAKASLETRADRNEITELMVQFFETAGRRVNPMDSKTAAG